MRRFSLTVLAFTMLAPIVTAQGWVSIAPEGVTEVRLAASKKEVKVTITTARVASDHCLFPDGDSFSGLSEVSYVTNVSVRAGDAEGGNYTLIISCRDGAEAYRAEIRFNTVHLTRRRVFSSLTPRDAAEDTRYKLTIFGQ